MLDLLSLFQQNSQVKGVTGIQIVLRETIIVFRLQLDIILCQVVYYNHLLLLVMSYLYICRKAHIIKKTLRYSSDSPSFYH